MLIYEIPGKGIIEIEHIVFDYNGTLAVDGKLIKETRELLVRLKKLASIYILTADTYGTVEKECASLDMKIMAFPQENASQAKREIVEQLGASKTMCIGNGFNDIEMCKIAALAIVVMEKEGCCGSLLSQADIVVASIVDALEIVLNPDRIKATLRN